MIAKVREKEEAIRLRKKGHSYRDILKEVPVSKSTISLWLSDFPLTNKEKKYLRKRIDANISRGRIKAASAHRDSRLRRMEELRDEAKLEFGEFVKDSLFHAGVSLYWAEGAKRNQSFEFSNSDPEMINVMIWWIEKFTNARRNDITARIYAHKSYAHENLKKFWSKRLEIPIENFQKTTIKPSNFSFRKRPGYMGCIKIRVPKGVSYLRKLIFWKEMLIEYYRIK